MEFRNCTKHFFDWDTEDDLDELIDPDIGSHPELAAESSGMLLEEDTPCPVYAVQNEKIDPNNIATADGAKSGIKNTTGVYDYSDDPNPIFTINPTPETEPDNTHEDSDDYDEDNDDDNEKVEEVELPEEYKLDPISIESDNADINY